MSNRAVMDSGAPLWRRGSGHCSDSPRSI